MTYSLHYARIGHAHPFILSSESVNVTNIKTSHTRACGFIGLYSHGRSGFLFSSSRLLFAYLKRLISMAIIPCNRNLEVQSLVRCTILLLAARCPLIWLCNLVSYLHS